LIAGDHSRMQNQRELFQMLDPTRIRLSPEAIWRENTGQ
jgi:hypothetical protein